MFCPTSTNDEEKDLSIQDRIRKLSWVNAHHLDCCISETSIEVRDLVYTAINDLLGNKWLIIMIFYVYIASKKGTYIINFLLSGTFITSYSLFVLWHNAKCGELPVFMKICFSIDALTIFKETKC